MKFKETLNFAAFCRRHSTLTMAFILGVLFMILGVAFVNTNIFVLGFILFGIGVLGLNFLAWLEDEF